MNFIKPLPWVQSYGFRSMLAMLLLTTPISCSQTYNNRPNTSDDWDGVHEILARITEPDFPERTFHITDYGAIGDGRFDCLPAFNKCVMECNALGGGAIFVPEGTYFLDEFTRVHLYGESKGIIGFYLNLFMALVILCIACINFINLTTAYSSGRIKEIFIRKSAGASKRQLIAQFMGETYLLLLFAFYLGLFIAEQLIPEAGRSFGVSIQNAMHGFSFWGQIALVFLVTGLLAGLYPALKIVRSLDGAFSGSNSGNRLQGKSRSRKVLIVVQFTFSLIFITATSERESTPTIVASYSGT